MAYVDQAFKTKIAPQIRKICQKYGVKATLAIRHHSTLVLNVSAGKLDFIGNYNSTLGNSHYYQSLGFTPATKDISVNPYHYKSHFTGKALAFLNEVMAVMNTGNFDKSDLQTDYFHVGWYVDINLGRWNKPYRLGA